jgi:hypothetical protein
MRSRPGSDGKIDQSIHPSIHPSIGYKKVGRATEVALPLGLTYFVVRPITNSHMRHEVWLVATAPCPTVIRPFLKLAPITTVIVPINYAVLVAPTWRIVLVKELLIALVVNVHITIKP